MLNIAGLERLDTVFDTELEFSSPAFAEVLGRRVQLIPALHTLLKVDDAGHELLGKKAPGDLPPRSANNFCAFIHPQPPL
jgi:hypothetical protein